MALASLGFSGGPQAIFRINPSQIAWSFQVYTNVIETVGGRVVQVTGSALQDLVVAGYFGEDSSLGSSTDGTDPPGASWRLAEAFLEQLRAIMDYQSNDTSQTGLMHQPATFSYPARGWRWQVYLKAIQEIDGDGAVEHRTGKYSYGYNLTLFPVTNGSDTLIKAGTSYDDVSNAQAAAITSYIDRISAGIGWTQTAYNGGIATATGVTGGSK